MSQEGRSTSTPNIVVFGQAGSGKSSLINMLARENIAKASSNLSGVTTIPTSYDISKESKTYTFWDTCGLNEGEEGSVPAQEAANNLIDLLNGMSVSLIIYIARGHRLLNEIHANYDLFCRVKRTCGKKVPIVLVVTGLEQEEDMDEWWMRHKEVVKGLNLSIKGHTCVTTIKGMNNMYEQEYQESRNKVWKLVETHCNSSHNISGEAAPRRVQEPGKPERHNVIVFGEAGCGKSSIVNMIVRDPVAKVSNGAGGCTFQNESYEADIDGTSFRIFDTAGLNEGDEGRVPHWKAVQGLYTLIRQLDGVSLLVFCVRGRVKANTRANWILFNKVICGETVPAIAVVTGLEDEVNPDDWWGREENKEVFRRYKMKPKDVSCVVSVRGHKNQYAAQYQKSQEKLRKLILNSYRREPWSKDKDAWFSHIYCNVHRAGIGFFPQKSKEFTTVMKNAVEEFAREVDMDEEYSERLKRTLLHAERVVERAEKRRRIKLRQRIIWS